MLRKISFNKFTKINKKFRNPQSCNGFNRLQCRVLIFFQCSIRFFDPHMPGLICQQLRILVLLFLQNHHKCSKCSFVDGLSCSNKRSTLYLLKKHVNHWEWNRAQITINLVLCILHSLLKTKWVLTTQNHLTGKN